MSGATAGLQRAGREDGKCLVNYSMHEEQALLALGYAMETARAGAGTRY